jgi:hypothetical protein
MVITAKRPNPNTPTKKKEPILPIDRVTIMTTENLQPGLKKVINEIDTDSYKILHL